jgi:hypothetical protein
MHLQKVLQVGVKVRPFSQRPATMTAIILRIVTPEARVAATCRRRGGALATALARVAAVPLRSPAGMPADATADVMCHDEASDCGA